MTGWFWGIGLAYFSLLIVLGFVSRKQTKSTEDYILAGSKIGAFVGMLTFAATLFSTFTLMGMPDFFRTHGVGAWIFLGVSDAAMFFFILWFGYHLRRRADKMNYQGVAGMLATSYQTPWAGYIYLLDIFCFLIPYVAIQIKGVALFFNEAFPDVLPVWAWSLIIVTVMLIYSEIGGLRAIIYCDVVQGMVLLVVIWIIAAGCIHEFGSVQNLFEQVRSKNPALLSTPGPKGLFTVQFLVASFVVILFFPVTQPQVTTRLVIVRSKKTMHKMAMGMSLFTALVIVPTVVIGLFGSIKYADVSMEDFIAGVLFHEQADAIAGLAMIGLLAAATSTADSQIFALGSEIRSVLLLQRITSLTYTRLAILGFGVAALVFSIVSTDQLVLLARVSFAGTAMMGPMVLAAVLVTHPPAKLIPAVTATGFIVFVASIVGILPSMAGKIRVDLLLMIVISSVTLGAVLVKKRHA